MNKFKKQHSHSGLSTTGSFPPLEALPGMAMTAPLFSGTYQPLKGNQCYREEPMNSITQNKVQIKL